MRIIPSVVAYFLLVTATFAADRLPLEEIALTRDIRYREGDIKACVLDLAMPKQAPEKPRPAIVVIHGGGWVEGDKSSFSTIETPGNILEFARLGFVAVTINYRLSGEAPFPAALDDCRCAVRWLRAHAEEYHVDPERVGAYGNSAGGHLALLLGMMEPEKVAATEPYPDQSNRVQAVVSDSGPIDLAGQHQQNHLRSVIDKFMGGPPDRAHRADYNRASPSRHTKAKDMPPLLLIYGDADTQVPILYTDDLVESLNYKGMQDVTYFRLAKEDHCPHSLVRIPYLQQAVEHFFSRILKRDQP